MSENEITIVGGRGFGFTELVDTDRTRIDKHESSQIASCLHIKKVRIIGVSSDAKTVKEFITNIMDGTDCVEIHTPMCEMVNPLDELIESLNQETLMLREYNYTNREPEFNAPSAQFVPAHIAHRKKFSNRPSKYRK